MTTLLTPREVIDLAFADSGYLPPDTIGAADLAAAEARFLIPVTGQTLWLKLIAGAYPTLRSDYAAPAAAFAVRLAVQPSLDVHAGQGGTTAPKGSSFQPAAREQLAAARRSLRGRLTTLLGTLSDHLDHHADDYPEYDPTQNVLRRVSIAGGVALRP